LKSGYYKITKLAYQLQRNFNGYHYKFDHARPRYGTADRATHWPTSGTPPVAHGTGSGNKFGTERASDAIRAATHTFSTLPKRAEINRCPELKMSTKTRSDLDFRLSSDVGPCRSMSVLYQTISPIYHSIPDILCTSGLLSHLEFRMFLTTDNVGSGADESGLVENRGSGALEFRFYVA